MGAYHLKSYALADLVTFLVTERGECIRLESETDPVFTVDGVRFLLKGPVLSGASAEEILRCAGNSREIRTFRKSGKVDLLYDVGDSRFLIRAVNAFDALRVEVHLLRS